MDHTNVNIDAAEVERLDGGLSRRGFLAGIGAVTVGAMASRNLFLGGLAHAGSDGPRLKLGVMPGALSATRTVELARKLHATVARQGIFIEGPEAWPGYNHGIDILQEGGLSIVLTIRNSGTSHYDPSSPPSDLKAYASKVRAIVEEHSPKVVVIENEMSGSTMYTGTASQYLTQLETAANVVSEFKGIKITDGGLPTAVVRDMTYQHYLDVGKRDKAERFLRKATSTEDEAHHAVYGSASWAEIGHSFVDGYADAGCDFVNFHWYERDGLKNVAQFLSNHTGLTAMSNEFGLRDKKDEEGQRRLMKQADGRLRYFIQFSIDIVRDGYPEHSVYALQDEDLSLRPIGNAYRDFAAGL